MLAGDVSAKKFSLTKWREGYDVDQVDDLLAQVEATFASYEQGRRVVPLTADEVASARFNPTKFRTGYGQQEVDDFLDQVVVALRQYEAR